MILNKGKKYGGKNKMLKNKKGNVDMIIGISVAVIMAVVMLGVVFQMVQNRTQQISGSQNYINITYGDVSYSLSDREIKIIVTEDTIINASGGLDMTSNCNITTRSGGGGDIRCDEGYGNLTNGVLINATYTYTREGYYTGATTRTIGNIIPILLAVGIIGIIALLFGLGKKD